MNVENYKVVLALVVGVVLAAWFGFEAIRRTLLFRRAGSWKSVQGTILVLRTFPSSKVDAALEIEVGYEYVVSAQKFVAYTPRLSGTVFPSNEGRLKYAASYIAGQCVRVYFDPADPNTSCLDRDWSGIFGLWCYSVFFSIAATVAYVFLFT
jgi:hypothetical protein